MSTHAFTAEPISAPPHHTAPEHPAPHMSVLPEEKTFDPVQFITENRIHVDGGSIFDIGDGMDGYLVLHPGELDPKNDTSLRKKLALTLSLNEPSFFESLPRQALAIDFGQLVPVPLDAEHSSLLKQVEEYNQRVANGGVDKNLQQHTADMHAPMSATIRDMMKKPESDPVGVATLKNGLIMYQLIRTKLALNGYSDLPEAHVKNFGTPEQVLSDLEADLGIPAQKICEVAASGGVPAVGKLLGFSDTFIAQITALATDAQAHQFSNNRIDNWILGMGKVGLDASPEQKVASGLQTRVEATISTLRASRNGDFTVPQPIREKELRIAEELKILPTKLLQAMHALGFEICYTPDYLSDKIAHFTDIFGLNRKTSNLPTDLVGTYRMYFSGHETLENQRATMVHEAHHVFFPELFTAEETTAIEQLFNRDDVYISTWNKLLQDPTRNQYGQTKFEQLKGFLGAYNAAKDQTPEQKAAIIEAANKQFAEYGVTLDSILPQLKDPERFKIMMNRANQDIRIGGERYQHGGYDDIPSRLREMISRYAELKYVRLHDDPALAKMLAPGMAEFIERYYPLQLDRVLQKIHHHELQTVKAKDHQSVVGTTVVATPAVDAAQTTIMESGLPKTTATEPSPPVLPAPMTPPQPETPTTIEPPHIGPQAPQTPQPPQSSAPPVPIPAPIILAPIAPGPQQPPPPKPTAPPQPAEVPAPIHPTPIPAEPAPAPGPITPATPMPVPAMAAPHQAVSMMLAQTSHSAQCAGCTVCRGESEMLHRADTSPKQYVNSFNYAGRAAQNALAAMSMASPCI